MIKTSRFSYGGTAAIVTSTALICGLRAAGATQSVMVSALLIAALADNLTDTLSVHIFQESQQLEQKEVFAGTITNFVTRLLLCISFVGLIMLVAPAHATQAAIVWGSVLLAVLTFVVARERKVNALVEAVIHLLIAGAVILASMTIGHWIARMMG